jgi:hypothetical protein
VELLTTKRVPYIPPLLKVRPITPLIGTFNRLTM